MDRYDMSEPINCGAGFDVSIRQLAEIVGRTAGFEGKLIFDTSKPDGTPKKLLDSSRLTALGWRPKTSLEEGIREVYRWFADTQTRKPVIRPAAT
jgi:GDP-L-fucose synthase